jgi:DNA polymerase III subunit epsilon
MKRLYIDVETGSLNPYTGALLQIGGIVEIDGVKMEEFSFCIKPFPDDVIEETALKANKFVMREIMEEGTAFEPPKLVFNALLKLLEKYIRHSDPRDKFLFIGYNSHSFDMPFVRNFFKKNKSQYFGSYFFFPSIDVMLAMAFLHAEERDLFPDFKLGTVCQKMGVEVSAVFQHDALYDAKLTRALYKKMIGEE